jgi:lipopolysaccharide export system protein LptC
MNVEGELFETNSLRVEQKKDLIYTDEFVTITQKKRIISGYGMRANQRLTRYTILKTQGVIPLDDDNADSTQVNDL